MSAPGLSVIMTCHNDADRLPAALRGLAGLTGTADDIETIVVDDGSTDATPTVLGGWDRGRVVRLAENRGVAAARHAGLDAARGEWVWFVDSDDSWPADAARSLLHTARETDADVVVAAARYTAEGRADRPLPLPPTSDRTLSGGEALRLLCRGDLRGHLWNKAVRRSVFAAVEFPSMRVHSDLAVTLQVLAAASRVVLDPAEVYRYRVRPGSLITSRRRRTESLAVLERVFDRTCATAASISRWDREYFRARFIVLSPLLEQVQVARADATGPWRRVTPLGVAACVVVGDLRRAAVAVLACVNPRWTVRLGRAVRSRRR